MGLFGAALESGRLYLSDSISDVGRVRLYHRALDQLFIAKADPVLPGILMKVILLVLAGVLVVDILGSFLL